ncbi:hypothetical protein CSKR_111954 [Clonorchis sinensis]|uniref:G-protein coupled receptors family 1 profile domain-containing protein n=1 Tax=Clonorchis sinensis TaxID=79923 RepID=A0A419PVQ2_CLOSI|nr:hypothetical protein CSKR_111954 [Clonorchis sinensis]
MVGCSVGRFHRLLFQTVSWFVAARVNSELDIPYLRTLVDAGLCLPDSQNTPLPKVTSNASSYFRLPATKLRTHHQPVTVMTTLLSMLINSKITTSSRVSNYLIFSLAIADLMVATLVMPISILNEVSERWWLGLVLCDFWVVTDVLCCTASILHLVAIAIDRYWAITCLNYVRSRTTKPVLVMIVVIWITALAISLPTRFHTSREQKTVQEVLLEGACNINDDYGFTIFSTVGAFYLPMGFIIAVYLKIYHTARSRIRKRNFRSSRQMGLHQQHASSSSWRVQLVGVWRKTLLFKQTESELRSMSCNSQIRQTSQQSTEQADQSCIFSDRTTSFFETEDGIDKSSNQTTSCAPSPVHFSTSSCCNHAMGYPAVTNRHTLVNSDLWKCAPDVRFDDLELPANILPHLTGKTLHSSEKNSTNSFTSNGVHSSSNSSIYQLDSVTPQNGDELTIIPSSFTLEDPSSSCSDLSGLDSVPSRVSQVDYFLWQRNDCLIAQVDCEMSVVWDDACQKSARTKSTLSTIAPHSPFVMDGSDSDSICSSPDVSESQNQKQRTTYANFLFQNNAHTTTIFPCSPYLGSSHSTLEPDSDPKTPLGSDILPPNIAGTLSDLSSVESYTVQFNHVLTGNKIVSKQHDNNHTVDNPSSSVPLSIWESRTHSTLPSGKTNSIRKNFPIVPNKVRDQIGNHVPTVPILLTNGNGTLPVGLDQMDAKKLPLNARSFTKKQPVGANMANSNMHLLHLPREHNSADIGNDKSNRINELPLDRKLLEAEQNRERLEHTRERKAAITVAIITGCFILCWLPFFVRALVTPFCKPGCLMPRWADSFFLWLGYLNSSLNPVLYTVFSPEFRAAFKKIVCGRLNLRSFG